MKTSTNTVIAAVLMLLMQALSGCGPLIMEPPSKIDNEMCKIVAIIEYSAKPHDVYLFDEGIVYDGDIKAVRLSRRLDETDVRFTNQIHRQAAQGLQNAHDPATIRANQALLTMDFVKLTDATEVGIFERSVNKITWYRKAGSFRPLISTLWGDLAAGITFDLQPGYEYHFKLSDTKPCELLDSFPMQVGKNVPSVIGKGP